MVDDQNTLGAPTGTGTVRAMDAGARAERGVVGSGLRKVAIQHGLLENGP